MIVVILFSIQLDLFFNCLLFLSFFFDVCVCSFVVSMLPVCVYVFILGHSKCGVYVCKYADVCIRQASVRRTWEGNVIIKMIVFKVSLKNKVHDNY